MEKGMLKSLPWWVKWVAVPVIALVVFGGLIASVVGFVIGLLFKVLVFVALVGGLIYVVKRVTSGVLVRAATGDAAHVRHDGARPRRPAARRAGGRRRTGGGCRRPPARAGRRRRRHRAGCRSAQTTTSAASAVVTGTEATRPIEPTSVRTISSATSSLSATVPTLLCAIENSSSSGSAAPA